MASCRRVWSLLPDESCRRAVEAAEAWADRAVRWGRVSACRREAEAFHGRLYRETDARGTCLSWEACCLPRTRACRKQPPCGAAHEHAVRRWWGLA